MEIFGYFFLLDPGLILSTTNLILSALKGYFPHFFWELSNYFNSYLNRWGILKCAETNSFKFKKNLVNIFCYEVCILLLSFYCLIHFSQMVENSGNHIAGFAAVLVFNSASKRLLGGLCLTKKSESVCINSLFIPFTHLSHSVLSCSFLCVVQLWLCIFLDS